MTAPVVHTALPLPGVVPAGGTGPGAVRLAIRLTTQVPVAVLAGFGMASGPPNRQPGLVQCRCP